MIPPQLLRASQGRHTALVVHLTPYEAHTLRGWQKAVRVSGAQARRGRLVLLVAAGVPIRRAARAVGLSPQHAYKWLKRYQVSGLHGLKDQTCLPGGAAAL